MKFAPVHCSTHTTHTHNTHTHMHTPHTHNTHTTHTPHTTHTQHTHHTHTHTHAHTRAHTTHTHTTHTCTHTHTHTHTPLKFFCHLLLADQLLYGFTYSFNLTDENAYFFVIPPRVSGTADNCARGSRVWCFTDGHLSSASRMKLCPSQLS